MKNKILIAVFVLLIVFATGFIFSNSIKNSAESNADSGIIIEIIKPLFDKLFPGNTLDLKYIIRKGAHFTEFALLGIFCELTAVRINRQYKKQLLSWALFYTLAVAVTDEYIQSFNDRTSAVSDILIDFAGAVFGICAVLLIYGIAVRIKTASKKKRDKR